MGKEIDRVCTVFASLYCLYNHQFILASLFIQSPVFASLYNHQFILSSLLKWSGQLKARYQLGTPGGRRVF